jgi:hypothetical protein
MGRPKGAAFFVSAHARVVILRIREQTLFVFEARNQNQIGYLRPT